MCSGKPFQPSLMFVDKTGAYPRAKRLTGASLRQAPGLIRKHQTRLERLASDTLSSLLQKFVNYGCNFFSQFWPLKRKKSFIALTTYCNVSRIVLVCLTFVGRQVKIIFFHKIQQMSFFSRCLLLCSIATNKVNSTKKITAKIF